MQVEDAAVDQALSQLRERAARYEPVEDRGVELGDSVLMDLVRTTAKKTEEPLIVIPGQEPPRETETDKHDNVTVDIGAPANPPGFDEALIGLSAGDQKSFDVVYPEDYTIKELAGTTVRYDVAVKAIRKRVVPGPGRRVRQGSRRVRFAGDADAPGCAPTSSTRPGTRPSARCAPTC